MRMTRTFLVLAVIGLSACTNSVENSAKDLVSAFADADRLKVESYIDMDQVTTEFGTAAMTQVQSTGNALMPGAREMMEASARETINTALNGMGTEEFAKNSAQLKDTEIRVVSEHDGVAIVEFILPPEASAPNGDPVVIKTRMRKEGKRWKIVEIGSLVDFLV
ncbi:MAG: hypothetical protein H0U67_08500 [Gemmatimonadetes bacterium]|nr:hypothetical protein [Gemmatimonadota bacterium]